jgi:hypothetical protein
VSVHTYVWNRYLAGKRWSLKQSPKVLHRLLRTLDTTLHSNTQVCLHTYIHTHTYNWGGSGGALNIVNLNTYISESSTPDTDCFEILTQRCIRIRACLYIGMGTISGWEAVEPQTISETSSPIASTFRHNVAFQYPSVCTHTYIYTHITGEEAVEP